MQKKSCNFRSLTFFVSNRSSGTRIRGAIQQLLWIGILLSIICNVHAEAAVNDLLALEAIPSPVAASSLLLDITHAGNRLVAVGDRGHIIYSDDAGKTWTQGTVPVMVTLTAVDFPTSLNGWAVGHDGVVLKTTDGGEHWTKIFTGEDANKLLLAKAERDLEQKLTERKLSGDADQFEASAEFEDLKWAVENARAAVDEGPWKPFMDVEFEDENRGLIIGSYGMIFKTEDGGDHWTPWGDHVPNPSLLHLNAFGRTQSGMFMVGEEGTLYRSWDGGNNWEAVDSPYNGSFFSVITREDSDTVIILGLRGNAYYSKDMGNTWIKIDIHVNTSLNGGYMFADGYAVILSSTIFFSRSIDGKFTQMDLPLSVYSSTIVLDDKHMIVVGMNGVKKFSIPGL